MKLTLNLNNDTDQLRTSKKIMTYFSSILKNPMLIYEKQVKYQHTIH